MAFKPRTTCPDVKDKHWIVTSSNGYNKCRVGSESESIKYGSALPNCVGYAWGRFLEILGDTDCKLSRGDAGTWYGATSDGYKRGKTPKVGAVICWSKPGDAGHVAIVEKVNSDGSIVTSESGWGSPWSKRFWTKTRTNSNGNWGASSSYIFQGFIYNPNASGEDSKFSLFLKEAESHVGEHGEWTWKTCGTGKIEWCAAYIYACAKTVGGLLDVVIPKTFSSHGIAELGVSKGYGKFYKGPGQGGKSKPKPGDIISFYNSTKPRSNKYSCDHVGIVYEVTSNSVKTIEGNTGTWDKNTSYVKKNSYSLSSTKICGYYRPNWGKVGGTSGYTSGEDEGSQYSDLYENLTTLEDMTVREVGYISSSYKPSIKSSDIKLSVINYTTMLEVLFKLANPDSGNNYNTNTDKLKGNCKIVVDYLLDKGLNGAASCGVAGNIAHESNFNTASIGDHGTSFGICQWHLGRGNDMKKYVGKDWSNDLTGQLDYLWYDLKHNFKSLLSFLKGVSNNKEGCRKAADKFVRIFEVPANVDAQSELRQDTAESYFNKIVIQKSTNVLNGECYTKSGKKADVVKTVSIPSSVDQSGLCKNYTNYTFLFPSWVSPCREIADIWDLKGRKSNRNIAVIDNYYLVAVAPTFGTTGDILTVELVDGTSFNAIVADTKNSGDSTYTKWGHRLAGGIDVIEWESISSGNKGDKQINLGSWAGVKVAKIHNRGKYMR